MVTKVKTLADFRAQHDPNVIIPAKIRTAIGAMLKDGAEHWEYELDFMRRAGVSTTQLAQFRDQFAPHIVETSDGGRGKNSKRVWFADPKVAKKLRSE